MIVVYQEDSTVVIASVKAKYASELSKFGGDKVDKYVRAMVNYQKLETKIKVIEESFRDFVKEDDIDETKFKTLLCDIFLYCWVVHVWQFDKVDESKRSIFQ